MTGTATAQTRSLCAGGSYYYIKNSFNGGAADAYGRAADIVQVGGWDGDGDDTLGVHRANTYYLKNVSGGTADSAFV